MTDKRIDDEVKFDDFDFDDSLDVFIDGEGGGQKKTSKRAVAAEMKKGFMDTVTKDLTDRTFARKFVGLMMPKGYSQAFNAYDGARTTMDKIYGENESELRPYLAKANRVLTRRSSRFKNLLPKGLRDLLDRSEQSEENDFKSTSELEDNLGGLDQLFSFNVSQAAEQSIEDKRKELKDDNKFKASIETQQHLTAGISRLVAYQDKILINYQRKNLEIGFRQFDVQRKLLLTTAAFHKDSMVALTNIQKNTGLPDYVKLSAPEALKGRLRDKLADSAVGSLSKYKDEFLKKTSDNFSGAFKGLLGMGSSIPSIDGINKGELFGNIVGSEVGNMVTPSLKFIAENIADLLSKPVSKITGVKSTGDKLRMALADIPGAINRFRQSEDEETGVKGWAKGLLKNSIAGYTPKDKIEGMDIADLQEGAMFDNFFYTSVTRVMPSFLESIDKTLRTMAAGEEQESQAYSHYTGSLVTRDTLDKQHVRIGMFRGKGNDIRSEVSNLMGQIGADDLSPQSRSALSKRLLLDLQKGLSFAPSDYVKQDSWPELDESTADELVDFFTSQFSLDGEGKAADSKIGFLAEVMEEFSDTANRIPSVFERTQALVDAGIIERSTLRNIGLTDYDGMNTDVLNTDVWTKMALGDDPLDITHKEVESEERSRPGVKNLFSNIDTAARKKFAEEEAKQRKVEEFNRRAGKYDVIDTLYGSTDASSFKPEPVVTQPTSEPKVTQPEDVSNLQTFDYEQFKLSDKGTHVRLDAILEKLNDLPISGGSERYNEAKADVLESAIDTTTKVKGKVKYVASKVTETATELAGKAKDKAEDLIDKAERWYKEDPKVREVVDRIEKTYGEVTSPENRARLIEQVYNQTGTPDEIYAKLSVQLDKVKAKLGQGKRWSKDKFDIASTYASEIYDNREEHLTNLKESVGEAYDKTAEKASEYSERTRDKVTELYGNRGKYAEKAKSGIKSAGEAVGGLFNKLTSGFSLSDKGTHRRLDASNKMLFQLLKRQGFEGEFESFVPKNMDEPKGKRGVGKSIAGGASWLVGRAVDTFTFATKGYASAIGVVANTAASVGSALFKDTSYGVRDILVVGDRSPRLRAVDIRAGKYMDKNTEKIITKLKHITGAVIEVATGNEVISQEEFDEKKLVDGKGDSLAMYFGRGAARLGMGVAGIAGGVMTAVYGTLGKVVFEVGKGVMELASGQFTQFDAYLPGDEEPRIRSKLMKQGFYLNSDGEPIMSLKDIKGEVLDKDGNVIISEEEIKTHKSLYKRNGSLLFTFGRGALTLGRWGIEKGSEFVFKAGTAILKGARKVGGIAQRAAGRLFNTGWGGNGDNFMESGYSNDLLVEQVRIQTDILETLKKMRDGGMGGSGIDHDEDGDGVRDNSWLDIQNKRKSRKTGGPNADVVDAISSLGDRIDNSLGELELGEAGESKGMLGGAMDKVKGWGGKALGALGMGKAGAALKGKSLLGGLGKVAGFAGKGMLKLGWGATKLAAKGVFKAVPYLIGGAIKVGAAVVSVVGWPAILIGIAVGAVLYLGWKYYKSFKFDQKPFHFTRMIQYGINPRDGERVEKILQLETLLGSAIKNIDSENPELDPKKIEMRKIYEIFGLAKVLGKDEEPPEDEEFDKEREEKLVQWLAHRFKGTYLRHISALSKLTKEKDLNKVDELIKTKGMANRFLDNINETGLKSVYDSLKGMTPFDSKLTEGHDAVVKAVSRARKLADEFPEDTATETGETGEATIPEDEKTKDTNKDNSEDKSVTKVNEVKSEVDAKPAAIKTMVGEDSKVEDAKTVTDTYVNPINASTSAVTSKSLEEDLKSTQRHVRSEEDVTIKGPSEESRAISKRVELENIQHMNESMGNSVGLLSRAVDKLTSMDSTLKDIRSGVNRLGDKPNFAAVSSDGPVAANSEFEGMAGEDIKAMFKGEDKPAGQPRYTQRFNPPPERSKAIT